MNFLRESKIVTYYLGNQGAAVPWWNVLETVQVHLQSSQQESQPCLVCKPGTHKQLNPLVNEHIRVTSPISHQSLTLLNLIS
jgi:hypothetical protein